VVGISGISVGDSWDIVGFKCIDLKHGDKTIYFIRIFNGTMGYLARCHGKINDVP
jgi:hypothetical protein